VRTYRERLERIFRDTKLMDEDGRVVPRAPGYGQAQDGKAPQGHDDTELEPAPPNAPALLMFSQVS